MDGRLFAVPSGPLQGKYDGVVVLTDLEADDAVALKVLASRLRGVPLLVGVGEGDTDKMAIAAGLLCWLGLDEGTVVVQSRRSATHFPMPLRQLYVEAASRSAARVLAPPNVCPHAAGDAAETARETFAGAQVELFLKRLTSPLALVLKPPHELVHVSPGVLSRIAAAMYGSFNQVQLRNVHWPEESGLREGERAEGVERAETVEGAEGVAGQAGAEEGAARTTAVTLGEEPEMRLLRSFRTLLWIERSSSCGRDCSLDASTAPELCAAAVGRDPKIAAHVYLWNEAIVRRSCVEVGMGGKEVEALIAAGERGPEEVVRRLADLNGDAGNIIHEKARNSVNSRATSSVNGDSRNGVHGMSQNSIERRLNKTILPNVRAGCMQVCHAGTLVVACLVDEGGEMAPWVGDGQVVRDTESGVRFELAEGALGGVAEWLGNEQAVGAGPEHALKVGTVEAARSERQGNSVEAGRAGGEHIGSVAAERAGRQHGMMAAALAQDGADREAFKRASVAVLVAEASRQA
jgi:hypothetical protein